MELTSAKMLFKSLFSLAIFYHICPSLIDILTENYLWNKTDKTPTFTGIIFHVTILTLLEAIRSSQEDMVDEVMGNIAAELRKQGTFVSFREKRMQSLLEGMCNKAEYGLKDSRKAAGQLKEFSNSKVMLNVLNRSNFIYHFCGGKFHMLPQSYKFSLGHCLNNSPQIWLKVNQRDQVPLLDVIIRLMRCLVWLEEGNF